MSKYKITQTWRIDEQTSQGVKQSLHPVFALIVTPLVFQTALTQLHVFQRCRNSLKEELSYVFQDCSITTES